MSFDKMPFPKDFLFCATGIILGRKVIIHDNGQYVRELSDSLSSMSRVFLKWLLKRCAACIVFGSRTKDKYEGLMPREKLYAVPGTVPDTRGLDVDGAGLFDKGEYTDILYFSYMSVSKGVLTAFDAAGMVLEKRDDARFLFAGPVESDEVRAACERLKDRFGGRVEFLGYIEDGKERAFCYRNADIFIFPTHRDVFGLVLLHAMAEACPVIAAREGCIPEVVSEGSSGFLVDKGDAGGLADKILLLINDKSLRQKMGRQGRLRYEKLFTPGHFAERMGDVIRALERKGHE